MMASKPTYPTSAASGGQPEAVQAFVAMGVTPGGIASPLAAGGAASIAAKGIALTTGGSSVSAAIPLTSTGEAPNAIRLAATAACYARLGLANEASAVPAAGGHGYQLADGITLAGGTFVTALMLSVATVALYSAAPLAYGTGYVPADTVTLGGGTHSIAAILSVATTRLSTAAVAGAGTGGTPGAVTLTGTTGAGTKFQIAGVIGAGGTLTSVGAISVGGAYTVNPTDLSAEPVTGGGLTGATLLITMGVGAVTVGTPGAYSATAASYTQAATSGAGVGATFNTAVYAVLTVTVADPGDYSVEPANPVAQGSTTGSGVSATFTVTWGSAATEGDVLVQPGDAITLSAYAPNGSPYETVAALQVTGAGKLQVSPLEN